MCRVSLLKGITIITVILFSGHNLQKQFPLLSRPIMFKYLTDLGHSENINAEIIFKLKTIEN